ncbi:MAG: hypothetical protein IPP20_11140 [Gemmatimonadetes bacterium]|nr:hypothetical protein [Gemmatimonadota bacterium]
MPLDDFTTKEASEGVVWRLTFWEVPPPRMEAQAERRRVVQRVRVVRTFCLIAIDSCWGERVAVAGSIVGAPSDSGGVESTQGDAECGIASAKTTAAHAHSRRPYGTSLPIAHS